MAKLIPVKKSVGFYSSVMVVGPLLGSLITEPAAMTLTALILRSTFFAQETSDKFKYSTLALLFVAISAGGTLTNFAAPPVLMVANRWSWSTEFMFFNFGWKSILAIFLMLGLSLFINWRELGRLNLKFEARVKPETVPWFVEVVFLTLLAAVVINAHEMILFVGLFLLFLGA